MSYFGKVFCFLLAFIVLLGSLYAVSHLPVPETGTLQRMEKSWSGVLRVWVCEGWECGSGSLLSWLNASAAQFEKRHKGVYVQISPVSAEVLGSFNYAAEYPPDMLLFAPGMLDSPDDLLPLAAPAALRAEFRGYGDGFVCPIAMGGYVWAVNRAVQAEDNLFLLPEDAPFLSYSAALPALLTQEFAEEGATAAPDSRYGIDLGLPAPTQAAVQAPAVVRRQMNPDLRSARDANAYARFTRAEAPKIAVTQREIRRLQLLDESGRGPDWEILVGNAAFTDQIMLASVVDIYRSDLRERQALCLSFLELLLSDERQKALSSARALRVTEGAPLYSGQRGMAQLEETMTSCALELPDPFDHGWRNDIREKADMLLSAP